MIDLTNEGHRALFMWSGGIVIIERCISDSNGRGFDSRSFRFQVSTLGKLFTHLSPNSIIWYWSRGGDALWMGR